MKHTSLHNACCSLFASLAIVAAQSNPQLTPTPQPTGAVPPSPQITARSPVASACIVNRNPTIKERLILTGKRIAEANAQAQANDIDIRIAKQTKGQVNAGAGATVASVSQGLNFPACPTTVKIDKTCYQVQGQDGKQQIVCGVPATK